MVGLLKSSLLWGSVLLTSRSAVKLSLDGCSSCSLKNSLFCILNWLVEIVVLMQKNKLSRKTFYSVLHEKLELGKGAAAVPCAFNTLSHNRELCVSIIWLHVCTHFLLAQLILWALLYIFKLKNTLGNVVQSRALLLNDVSHRKTVCSEHPLWALIVWAVGFEVSFMLACETKDNSFPKHTSVRCCLMS